MSRQGRRRGQEESCTPWLAGFSMSASLVIESVVGRCYLYRSIRAISHGGEEDDVCTRGHACGHVDVRGAEK